MTDQPVWIAVRMTAARANRLLEGPRLLQRGHVYLVDASEPQIQHELRATWMVPLPAAEQPSTEDLGLAGRGATPAPENSKEKP